MMYKTNAKLVFKHCIKLVSMKYTYDITIHKHYIHGMLPIKYSLLIIIIIVKLFYIRFWLSFCKY